MTDFTKLTDSTDSVDENTIAYQRDFWSSVLESERGNALCSGDWSRLGFSWGDPESEHAIDGDGRSLGDYATVLRRLRALATPDATVLELGSYGGKWTQYLLRVHFLWCVDLSPTFVHALIDRFKSSGSRTEVGFYVTPGDDLADVPDTSVDLIFSMDSLVRAPLDAIASYLAEFYRVLHVGGHVLVHLPWDDSPGSRERNFTRLSRPWLLAHISQFRRADLDETTLKHGLLLHLVK